MEIMSFRTNILIIDDQTNLQELFSKELRDEGYRVFSISEAEALAGFLNAQRPDLVLLDLYLNGTKGWDVLHDIKTVYPQLPVLIVTAYDNYTNDPRLSEADGYVIKDFHAIGELKKKISETLENRFC